MTEQEKAARYDELLKYADVANRELSRLKSANAGVNTTSDEYNRMVAQLNKKLAFYEAEMRKLFL
jgi:hypothetical protein